MGKGSKKKNADFQKVKLKVGKRRPAGTNATDTSFKTSSIHIASQLEEHDAPTNKRNLSLKELLGQLNHYNVSFRHNALLGIRDLFTAHPAVIQSELSKWLPRVLEKNSDTDPAVRHALRLCLGLAFHQLQANECSPFMKIIIAHVCCGITHIDEEVQLDSLALLDIVLDSFPTLVVPHLQKVLTNIVDIIGKQSAKETSASQTAKGTKVKGISSLVNWDLSSLPKAQLTSLKTKTKVLEKLNKILQVLLNSKDLTGSLETSTESFVHPVFHISKGKEVHLRMFKYGSKPRVPKVIPLQDLLASSTKISCTSMDSGSKTFVDSVFPVLIHCWIEYSPYQLVTGIHESGSLSVALNGMHIILRCASLLLKLLSHDTSSTVSKQSPTDILISSPFFKDFCQHFVNYFPLPFNTGKPSHVKSLMPGKLDPLQQFAIEFNQFISTVLCDICHEVVSSPDLKSLETKQISKWTEKLSSYVELCQSSNVLQSSNNISQFLGVVRGLLKLQKCIREQDELLDSCIGVTSILGNLAKLYSRASLKSPVKVAVLLFFKELVVDRSLILDDPSSKDEVNTFLLSIARNLGSLPSSSSALVKEGIDLVKIVVSRGLASQSFADMLESSLVKLTDEKGVFRCLPPDQQKTLIEIVYSLPSLSEILLKNFAYLCHAEIDNSVKVYLLNIIGLCAFSKSPPSLSLELFISFILSVVVGFSTEELKVLHVSRPNYISWNTLNIFRGDLRHVPVEHAVNQLKQVRNCSELWSVMMNPIGRILVMIRSIPVCAAVGLIKLLESLWLWREKVVVTATSPVESETNQVADLVSAVLLYCVSETYKQTSLQYDERPRSEALEDDLICASINLLSRNAGLCRLLVQKWKHIVTEYKMNSACVSSIIEVLICLLQDESLLSVLRDMKPTVESISSVLLEEKLMSRHSNLIQDLQYHISLLH